MVVLGGHLGLDRVAFAGGQSSELRGGRPGHARQAQDQAKRERGLIDNH